VPRKLYSRLEALRVLVAEAQRDRLTKVGYGNAHRALVSLELPDEELAQIESDLGYRSVHKPHELQPWLTTKRS